MPRGTVNSGELSKTKPSAINIGSYSACVTILPRWDRLWKLFASADGLEQGDQVVKLIRAYQESGFKPPDTTQFHSPFFRRVFVDLVSGLELQFDDQGCQVMPTRNNQGWLLYDNTKNRPIESPGAEFASAYFTLGWSEFKIDRMKMDWHGIDQHPVPMKTYLHTSHGRSLSRFIQALVRLENASICESQTPFLVIPSTLSEELAKDDIRYIVEEGAWRMDPPEEMDGFEFGMCEYWCGHQLQSDYLDFYIKVEGFSNRRSLLEE
jgi:hypothetical protein